MELHHDAGTGLVSFIGGHDGREGMKKVTRKTAPHCVIAHPRRCAVDGSESRLYKGLDVGSSMVDTSRVSVLLRAWGHGDLQARDELLPLVYEQLRAQAARYLRRERRDHTLQPTALVHEAYMRLIGQARVSWQNRAHFFGIAAQMMRRILVDHARRHQAAKRSGAAVRVAWGDSAGATPPLDCELLLLDQALAELADRDARQAHVVELRYFGGLSEQEAAEVLTVSRATVTRDWNVARAWLFRRMTEGITEVKGE
jgi:RNA polymerase sigma-70 factor (ECF subfamily)